jgi:4'-phosphopantetheinyl transferase EntD
VVGSITLCAGYRAAAVAMQVHVSAIGIDPEIREPLPPEIVNDICIAEEIAWLRQASNQFHWDRVLFSAKESVYKPWFPLTQRWLGFEEVAITDEAAKGAFRARPLISLPRDFDQILR